MVAANRSASDVDAVNLQSDDFELFGLPRRFSLVGSELDQRWKDLQRQVHPDKFAAEGDSAQRLAMQWSVRVNEAYRRLKDPLARAAYLCSLGGSPVNAHSNTAMPTAFLMQQMQWREELDDASNVQALESLRAKVYAAQQRLLGQCAEHLDGAYDFAAASEDVRSLMFIDKFLRDLDARLEQLDHA